MAEEERWDYSGWGTEHDRGFWDLCPRSEIASALHNGTLTIRCFIGLRTFASEEWSADATALARYLSETCLLLRAGAHRRRPSTLSVCATKAPRAI